MVTGTSGNSYEHLHLYLFNISNYVSLYSINRVFTIKISFIGFI